MEFLAAVLRWVLDRHREIHQALATALNETSTGAASLGVLAGMALLLGMIHALTPGHGKMLLFAYFLGRRARPWSGVASGVLVALMHVGTAVLVVMLFGAAASVLGRPAGAALLLQAISAIGVTAAGSWYLWRALRPPPPRDGVGHGHGHSGVALAAGLLPCPLTMMILSMALARASLGIGLLLVGVMALGIAATVALIATAAIVLQRGLAAGLEHRLHAYHRVLRGLEGASAAVILLIGIGAIVVLVSG